ncbi:MAG: hypothetical protein WCF33_01880 [Pseudonocardiaceae bacterium]
MKQLLDHARLCGFTFQRTAPGVDAPLVGHRVSDDWIDLIYIEGFSRDCSAWREWTFSLIVSQDELGQCQRRVEGSAVHVLNEVLTRGAVTMTAHSRITTYMSTRGSCWQARVEKPLTGEGERSDHGIAASQRPTGPTHYPPRGDIMPTPPPRPNTTVGALCDFPLLDADGAEIRPRPTLRGQR